MKVFIVVALCLATTGVGYGQTLSQAAKALPPDTAYAVVSQGANHRVWEKTSYELGPDGKAVPKVHRYTELASGLNYQDASGQWQASKEEIESYPGGAIARQGQYQVIFANNLNSSGAIDMQTPDGKRLRSNILGLMYYDTATGNAVLVARLQDSEGELVSANQVLYPDAFKGVKADVRYTYHMGSFEQDVILREQPPAPETYGMNPQTTELEVMTEFINPPTATIIKNAGQADEAISWDATRLGHGRAFDLGTTKPGLMNTSVDKQYIHVQGRYFLLEKVKLPQVEASISKLPLQASRASINQATALLAQDLALPGLPPANKSRRPMRVAMMPPANQGYVLDYVQQNSSLTNYTFQGIVIRS